MSYMMNWKTALILLALPLAVIGCKPKADQAVQEEVTIVNREAAPADAPAAPAAVPADTTAPDAAVPADTTASDAAVPADTANTAAANTEAANGTVAELAGADAFDAFIQSAPVVVTDFCATWCGPCRKLAPVLAKMAKAYAKDGVKFASFDVDQNEAICQRLGVNGIPDVRIFIKGQQFAQTTGNIPEEIMSNLEEAVKLASAAGSDTTAAPVPASDPILDSSAPASDAPAQAPAEPPASDAPAEVPAQ